MSFFIRSVISLFENEIFVKKNPSTTSSSAIFQEGPGSQMPKGHHLIVKTPMDWNSYFHYNAHFTMNTLLQNVVFTDIKKTVKKCETLYSL